MGVSGSPAPPPHQGYTRETAYIITQHPLATTREDFWEMVLSTNANSIVMIGTLEKEEVGLSGGVSVLSHTHLNEGVSVVNNTHLNVFE